MQRLRYTVGRTCYTGRLMHRLMSLSEFYGLIKVVPLATDRIKLFPLACLPEVGMSGF